MSVQLLESLDLFAACAPEDLAVIAGAVTGERAVAEGEDVCVEGDKADRWWIVVDGLADVTVAGLYVGSIGPGETIGELALLDGDVRGATVTAMTEMLLEEVNGDGFLDALEASPRVAIALLQQIAARLRTTNRLPIRPPRPAAGHPSALTAAAPAQFDPRTPGYSSDPATHTAAVRETAAVQWSDALASFVVTRYHDVHRLTRDRSLVGSVTAFDLHATSGPKPGGRMLINLDGGDHTQLRGLMSRGLTPRAVAQWQWRTEEITERLLAAADEHHELDVIADFALPLPAQVISEMLGMPTQDSAQLRAWSRALTLGADPFSTEADRNASEDASRAMSSYVFEVIADKRHHPADDLLTTLLRAEDDGTVLDDKEVLAQVLLLYIAGHETTLNIIGNGLTHLFEFPDQLDALREDPGLDTNGIEELLRFDSPAQLTRRITTQPLDVGGVELGAGARLTLLLASANRDPRKWGDTADVVDVARACANEHVSFGGGAHFCLGASLARMEARVALPRLVRRFPRMAPAYDEPAWADRMLVRGVDRLPVTLH